MGLIARSIESGAFYCISLLTMLLMPDKPYRVRHNLVLLTPCAYFVLADNASCCNPTCCQSLPTFLCFKT